MPLKPKINKYKHIQGNLTLEDIFEMREKEEKKNGKEKEQ